MGFTKEETETLLKFSSSKSIESCDRHNNDLQRKFSFNHIFDNKSDAATFFTKVVKPLAKSAFIDGLQHSIILYEPATCDYYVDFLGITDPNQNLDELLLFHTLNYIIELASIQNELQSPVQISLVGVEEESLKDLFNPGVPLESPLGYSLEGSENIQSFLEYAGKLLDQNPNLEHLCVSIYYQNRILSEDFQFEVSLGKGFYLIIYRQEMPV